MAELQEKQQKLADVEEEVRSFIFDLFLVLYLTKAAKIVVLLPSSMMVKMVESSIKFWRKMSREPNGKKAARQTAREFRGAHCFCLSGGLNRNCEPLEILWNSLEILLKFTLKFSNWLSGFSFLFGCLTFFFFCTLLIFLFSYKRLQHCKHLMTKASQRKIAWQRILRKLQHGWKELQNSQLLSAMNKNGGQKMLR